MNNKKSTLGRNYGFKPVTTLIGANIVAKPLTKTLAKHLSTNPAEKRLAFVPFERSEKQGTAEQAFDQQNFQNNIDKELAKYPANDVEAVYSYTNSSKKIFVNTL